MARRGKNEHRKDWKKEGEGREGQIELWNVVGMMLLDSIVVLVVVFDWNCVEWNCLRMFVVEIVFDCCYCDC